jgi:hypothetical protein
MILQSAPAGGGPRETARTPMTKAGFTEVGAERSLNGDQSCRDVSRQDGDTDVGLRAAFIKHGDQTLMLAAWRLPISSQRRARSAVPSRRSYPESVGSRLDSINRVRCTP